MICAEMHIFGHICKFYHDRQTKEVGLYVVSSLVRCLVSLSKETYLLLECTKSSSTTVARHHLLIAYHFQYSFTLSGYIYNEAFAGRRDLSERNYCKLKSCQNGTPWILQSVLINAVHSVIIQSSERPINLFTLVALEIYVTPKKALWVSIHIFERVLEQSKSSITLKLIKVLKAK